MVTKSRIPHPSFGVVPEEKFREAQKAPAMEATTILRKYDPLFGFKGKTKTFTCCVTQKVAREDKAYVEVEAADEKHARQILDGMDWDQFGWDEGWEDTESSDIESVKEKTASYTELPDQHKL